MPDPVALPSWLVAVLALGSAIGVWKALAGLLRSGARADLERVLAQKFATLDEVNGLGAKVTALQKVAELANEQAEEALATAERASERASMLESQVIPQLSQISQQLQKQGELLAKQTGVLETFMDEYRRRK